MKPRPAPERVLVTGGAGFLGSHPCEAQMASGAEVLCVDNLYTGTKVNIASLMDHPLFEFMRHDVTIPLDVAYFDDVLARDGRPAVEG